MTQRGLPGIRWEKYLTYDEFSLPQWVAGQPSHHAGFEPNEASGVTDEALYEGCSLITMASCQGRAAWASSIHQVEEGTLTFADSTIWAKN